MPNNKFFSFARKLIFEDLSRNYRLDSFKNFMDLFYIIFEKIAFSFEFLYTNYMNLYDDLVEKEVKLAKILSVDQVLVIGCGSLPATSILIAMKTKSKIVSIDCDKKATRNAARFIKRLDFDRNIIVENADGISQPIENYDVILIAYGIKQQKEMLIDMSKKLKNNSRIIYRTTKDVLDKKVGGFDFLSNLFTVEGYIESEKIPLNISYLLKKK